MTDAGDGEKGGVEIIRVPATAAGLLASLHAECFADAWNDRLFASLLHLPGGAGFLARVRGAPAGFAVLRQAADEAELLTLGVAAPARRRGLGRRLLMHAMAFAQAAAVRTLFLEVAPSNAPARALYAWAGFAPIGRRVGYYAHGEDALVMRRALPPLPDPP